jgi:hypothetical protein
MKYLILIAILLIGINSNAQINCFSSYPIYAIDSTGFEADTSLKFVYQIDTVNHNNIWQIGNVTKPGFDSAYSGTHALQTDTLNPYPINDTSAFYVWILHNQQTSLHQTFSMTWMQKYNMSNMLDSGIIQFSIDTGATWHNINNSANLQPIAANINFNGVSKNKGSEIFFTDSSKGWEKATICVTFLGFKKPLENTFGFRFMLKTDSIADNKPGWMLDNFKLYTPSLLSSNNNLQKHILNIQPNPSKNFITIQNNKIEEINIYNMQGALIQKLKIPKNEFENRIDISNFVNGIYYLDAIIDSVHFGEKFMKE